MDRNPWLIVAAVSGLSAVALGAFGAHAIRDSLSNEMLAVYRTASLYHLVHSAVLLAVAIWMEANKASHWLRISAWLFAVGILLFSGSLYLLAVTGIGSLGAITPLGGLAFLAAWTGLIMQAVKPR